MTYPMTLLNTNNICTQNTETQCTINTIVFGITRTDF